MLTNHRNIIRSASAHGALIVGLLAYPIAASAADDAIEKPTGTAAHLSDQSDAIVVTARHRKESAQDVPLGVTTVAGAELGIQHLDRVADYTAKVPNFSALQQNTRVSGLYIRGLGGNASNDGAEGGVGLIVDGVFFTHVGFSWLDFVDLEGIEVVRGPQGTLLGKNTTIGAVIVKTAKPQFTPEYALSATYGDRGRYQLRANTTGPLIKDKLAYRLTFATDQGGGWIPNAYNGDKLLNNGRWSVRGQLLFTPTGNISSRLIVEHYETHEYNNFYPPVADVNQNLALNGSVISNRNSWSTKLRNIFGYTPNLNGPYNANLDSQQKLVSRTDGISNEINWNLGDPTLTAISAWRRLYFRPYNDSDYTPLPIDRSGFNVDVNQLSQEVRLASPSGRNIEWTLGAYYLHEVLDSNLVTDFYQDASAFVIAPTIPSSVLSGVEYDKNGHLVVDSGAAFAQATYHVTKAFLITGGLRYTRETKSVENTGSAFGGATLSAALAPFRAGTLASFGGTTAAAGGVFDIGTQNTRDSVSWLINPSLKLSPNILLYGSASYGEKSGAANTNAGPNLLSVILTQPEKSSDLEIGFKTTWLNKRLTLNANFYRDTITNYQDAAVDLSNPGIGSFLTNVGEVRLQGAEFEASLHLLKKLTISVTEAHNIAKYKSYENAPAPIEYSVGLGAAEGVPANAATLSLTGYQIRNAPRDTVTANISYETPINDRLSFTGYVTEAYRSSAALVNPRSKLGWQSAYGLTNIGIGIKAPNDRWSLLLWSKNVFNKFYATAFGAPTALAPLIQVYGDPRRTGLTLSVKL